MIIDPDKSDAGHDTDHFRVLILKKFDDQADAQRKTNEILGKLTTALVGDPTMGTTGLVTRVADVEKQSQANGKAIEAEATRVNIKLAWLGGVGTAVGTIIGFAAEYLTGRR